MPPEITTTKNGRIPTAILLAEQTREHAYNAYIAAERAFQQTLVEFGHLLPEPQA